MNAYQAALKHFLDQPGIRQQDVAAKIGKSQPALNRYARGFRFPDAETARLIDDATDGVVSLRLWQSVAMARLGIESGIPDSPSEPADNAEWPLPATGKAGKISGAEVPA